MGETGAETSVGQSRGQEARERKNPRKREEPARASRKGL